jgi:hypothetical protein
MDGTLTKTYIARISKGMHLIAIVVLAFIWSFQVYSCIYHFKQKPRYFEQKLVPQATALYPSITICPNTDTAGYKDDVLKVLIFVVFILNLT